MAESQFQQKAEVKAVLASDVFKRAPTVSRILAYVCKRYFAGELEKIREYNIGVEALGREPVAFEAGADPIVRVEATRLRKRLKDYYAGEGAGHPIQLRLPRSGYIPEFVSVEDEPGPEGEDTVVWGGEPPDESTPPALAAALAETTRKRPPERRLSSWLLTAGVGLLLAGALAAWWLVHTRGAGAHVLGPGAGASGRTATPPGDAAPLEGIRILAGYTHPRFVDNLGQLWLSDRYYTGGWATNAPADDILGVTDPVSYRTAREGTFRYDIPLKPGVYDLRLLFMEIFWGRGNRTLSGDDTRTFDVSLNGLPLLSELDVLSDVGLYHVPADRVFKDISPAPDGFLHLAFTPAGLGTQPALLCGIEIVPGTRGRLAPVRIAAGGPSYWDRAGRLWGADRYFVNGRAVSVSNSVVRGTSDPELYVNQRYGHFSYSIPVAPQGRYRVTLKFAELFWGTVRFAPDGQGRRVFDVFCNGIALLRNFEILKAAGQSNLAVDRVFHGLTPNAQGRLVLSFESVRDYAAVQAIEVLDESPR
jgi:hypothetical protein